jgi:hypothetical protein
MSEGTETQRLNNGDAKWHKVGKVQVFARRDGRGRPTKADAIDEDDDQIRAIADRLHRAGYGVLRERNPRAGRVYHRLQAVWAGPGDPPEDPFGSDSR